MRGARRSLAQPAFAQDDGSADEVVRAFLADPQVDVRRAARFLRSARLVAAVVAVLDEQDAAGGDKDSHMAVVSMVNDRGERGLLAFTGVDSLTTWNPDARPVAALGRDVARTALADGAAAVIIDVSGPHRITLAGIDLEVLSDALDLAAVRPIIEEALAPLMSPGRTDVVLHDVRASAVEIDLLVELPGDLVEPAVVVLAAHRELQGRVPGGVGVRQR